MLKIKLQTLDARYPTKGSKDSAGLDLYACEDTVIGLNKRQLVDTGIIIETMPHGHYARIAPRSGLAVKGIDVGAGVVDSDYRGIVKVVFINNSGSEFKVNKGDRIAQLILEKCTVVEELHVNENGFVTVLVENDLLMGNKTRGSGGFGSTGK